MSEPASAPRAPVVLAFGLRPERLLGDEGRIDEVLEPPSRDQISVLIDALQSGLQAAGAVVAIVPDWFGAESLARLRTARSLLADEHVAIHVTPLPPLAATVLASLTSAAGRYAPSAGVLASLLPELETQLHVVTWLGSVGGLTTPAPSVTQHLASFAPGTAFAVSSHPEPAVHRVQAGDASVPLPALTRPSRLAVAAGSGDVDWILGPVRAALGGIDAVEVAATPGGPSWWGTRKLVEAVAFPTDVAALVTDLLVGRQPWNCRWCGEPIVTVPCPLCGHRGRPPG